MIRSLVVERWSLVRRLLPADIYLWLKALLLAGIAVQLVRLLWVVVTPVGPFGDWQPASARLLPPQTQAAILAAVDPFNRGASIAAAAAPVAAAIELTLFGVRADARGSGSAILGAADGQQTSFVVGEEVSPGVRLASVGFDHVVLDQGGRQQTIYMEGAEGADAAPVAIAGAAAPSAGQPFALRPRMSGDRVTGVMVAPGANQALFQAAGFQSGDVIVAVNGARITSQIDVQQLQSSAVPGARLLLTVERGAQAVPIALNIPGSQ
ncbi:MAG: PDZ domain-containing protein [Pseudomonadota bacterium]|nr:PDZ domain-containing protein [Pseudomonadota bacterium]